ETGARLRAGVWRNRSQETNEQVTEAGRFLMVAKGIVDALPERLCQVELFNVLPAYRSIAQVDVVGILDIGPGVEQGAKDSEEFRLVSLDHHGQHLAIQVSRRISRGYERLQFLEPLLVVEERAALAEMVTEIVMLQAQLIEEDRGPV